MAGSAGEEARKDRPPPLEDCLDLAWHCYRAVSLDLYAIGLPAIALVQSDRILNLTALCAQLWATSLDTYVADLTTALLQASASP